MDVAAFAESALIQASNVNFSGLRPSAASPDVRTQIGDVASKTSDPPSLNGAASPNGSAMSVAKIATYDVSGTVRLMFPAVARAPESNVNSATTCSANGKPSYVGPSASTGTASAMIVVFHTRTVSIEPTNGKQPPSAHPPAPPMPSVGSPPVKVTSAKSSENAVIVSPAETPPT